MSELSNQNINKLFSAFKQVTGDFSETQIKDEQLYSIFENSDYNNDGNVSAEEFFTSAYTLTPSARGGGKSESEITEAYNDFLEELNKIDSKEKICLSETGLNKYENVIQNGTAYNSSNETVINLSNEEKSAITEQLKSQAEQISENLSEAKKQNGWISGAWDAFKNFTGIGAGSDKAAEKVEILKSKIAESDENPDKLPEVYKEITGKELTNEELQKFLTGESSLLTDTEASEAVEEYTEGQKMATDTVADIVSGIAAVGAVTIGTVAGVCAAPFTGGASLGLIAAGIGIATATGAAVKIGLKASDCIGNEKEYTLADAGYDTITGGINGAMGPISNGLGGTAGKAVMKAAGKEALETTAKTTFKQFAIKAAAKGTEMAVDGTLSGAADGFARAVGQGRIEDIPQEMITGGIGGAVAAPIIGTGFHIAGKAGSKAGNAFKKTLSKEIADNTAKETSEVVSRELSESVTDETISGITKEVKEKSSKPLIKYDLQRFASSKTSDSVENTASSTVAKDISSSSAEELSEKLSIYTPEQKKQLLLDKGVSDYRAKEYIDLEEGQFSKFLTLLDKGFSDYRAKEYIDLEEEQFSKFLTLLDKGVSDFRAKELADLEEGQFSKLLTLLDKGVPYFSAEECIDLEEEQFSKFLTLLDKGIYEHSAKKYAVLEEGQFSKFLTLLDKGVADYKAEKYAVLEEEQFSKFLTMLDKGFNENNAYDIAQLQNEQYVKAINLTEENIHPAWAKDIAILEPEQYTKTMKLINENYDIEQSYKIATLDEKETEIFQKKLKYITEIDPDAQNKNLACLALLGDEEYKLAQEYLKINKSVDTISSIMDELTLCHTELNEKGKELLKRGLNRENCENLKRSFPGLFHDTYEVSDEIYTKLIQKLDNGLDINDPAVLSLCNFYNYNREGEDILSSKLYEKIRILSDLEKLKSVYKKKGLFTDQEIALIDKQSSEFAKNLKQTIQPTKVSEKSVNKMMKTFFANNNESAERILKTANFTNYGKSGLPLEYPRKEFLRDLSVILQDVSETEKQKILKKLDIKTLEPYGQIIGYDGIIDLSKLNIQDSKQKEIYEIAHKFIKENRVQTGNSELDKMLNALTEGMPEFINVIGKQQHATQSYSVDIHILKVLQEAMNNKQYEMLTAQDKTTLKFATIFHDIAKAEGITDQTHPEISALYTRNIMEKYNFSREMKSRIYETVKNHHWLAEYNTGNISPQYAGALFRHQNDFTVAEIMAESDLKGVSDDFYKQYSNALRPEKTGPIKTSLNKINQNGQAIFTSKIINPDLIPEVNHNGINYKVIDIARQTPNEDLSKYGFNPGTTKDSLRLAVHMVKQGYETEGVKLLEDPAKEGFLCTSFISPDVKPTFAERRFGVSLETENVNIANAGIENQFSGFQKGFNEFAEIIGEERYTRSSENKARHYMPNYIKETLKISDDEYAQLYQQVSGLKYITQIKDDKIYKTGEKTFTGKEIKEALSGAQDKLLTGQQNEVNMYNPKINAVVAKVDNIEEIPQEFLDFAKKYDKPVLLLGKD